MLTVSNRRNKLPPGRLIRRVKLLKLELFRLRMAQLKPPRSPKQRRTELNPELRPRRIHSHRASCQLNQGMGKLEPLTERLQPPRRPNLLTEPLRKPLTALTAGEPLPITLNSIRINLHRQLQLVPGNRLVRRLYRRNREFSLLRKLLDSNLNRCRVACHP